MSNVFFQENAAFFPKPFRRWQKIPRRSHGPGPPPVRGGARPVGGHVNPSSHPHNRQWPASFRAGVGTARVGQRGGPSVHQSALGHAVRRGRCRARGRAYDRTQDGSSEAGRPRGASRRGGPGGRAHHARARSGPAGREAETGLGSGWAGGVGSGAGAGL
jgi:hypothetical protein